MWTHTAKLKFLAATAVLSSSVACNKISFADIVRSCEATSNSARYAGIPGPVVTSPSADTTVGGTVTVSGTCANGFSVSLQESNGAQAPVITDCVNGQFSAAITLSSNDGLKDLIVTQPTGDAGAQVADRLCFSKDGTPPLVLIDQGSGAQAVNSTVSTITGTCESGLMVTITGPGMTAPVTAMCTNGHFSAPVTLSNGDGLKNIVASQIDPVGNNGQDNTNVLVDSTAPIVRITSPAVNTMTNGSLNVGGTCETGLRVGIGEPNSGNAQYTSCTGGSFTVSVALAQDGINPIKVFQIDEAGNIGTDSRNFVRDGTAPNVTINSPLANAYLQNSNTFSGNCETGIQVNLTGSAIASTQNVNCSNGAWSYTGSVSSGQGSKSLTAKQTDGAGNSAQAQRNYNLDTVAPVLTFTSPAANSYVGANATITGTCESGFQVNVSGSGLSSATTAACNGGTFSSSVTISNGDGTKSVNLSQTDAAGNTGSASRNFVRDSGAPTLSITSPVNGAYVSNTATISGNCEAGLAVSLSGSGLASNASGTCSGGGSYSIPVNISSGDGAKAILASSTDGAGNVATSTASYIKDGTAPLVAITSPAAGTQAQSGLIVSGTCETGLNVSLTGNITSVSTACAGGTFSAAVVFSAVDGNKNVTAAQTDAAGNTGSDSRVFARNNAAPLITITAPAVNAYVGANFTLTGACVSGLTVSISGAGVAPASTVCSGGAYSVSLTTSAGDGVKAVVASETDAIGNTGSASRNFVRDSGAPTLSINSPVNGAYVSNSATISGNCEAGLTVSLSGSGLASNASGTCSGGGSYSIPVNISAGDGAKTILASSTDGAGNVATANASYIKDGTAPLVAITSPAAGTQGQTGLTVSGTCEAGLNVSLSGNITSVSTACVGGTFSAAVVFSGVDGNKNVTAAQTDAAGNTGSNSRVFVRNNAAPALTINSPAANSYVGATFVLTGNCVSGLTVNVTGSGTSTPGDLVCAGGSYSTTLTTSGGDGVKTITVSETDFIGNTATVSRNFVRDSTPPLLTIASPANGSLVGNTATITGTCEAGLTISFSGAGLANGTTGTCSGSGTYSANVSISSGDGVKVVTLSETDAAGNNSTATGSFNKDGTAPLVQITNPASGTAATTGLIVSGSCEIGLNVTLSGNITTVTTACAGGTFLQSVVFTGVDGNKTVTASQTDGAGNTGSDSRIYVKDTTGPAVAITSPAANSFVGATFVLAGTCEAGLSVTIGGAGVSGGTVACSSGNFSTTLTTSAGDGVKVVTATQTDSLGNVGTTSRSFQRDSTAPNVTINSPLANASVLPTATIAGNCETGLTVALTGDLQASASGACSNGAYSINVVFTNGLGVRTVTASQTDAQGNTGTVSRSFQRLTDAGYETFVADQSFGKIDILFVDDNSGSMDPQQTALGNKFSGFSNELTNIDWQIGITTTDCSDGPYGICGSLLQLTGINTDIMTPATPNFQTIFKNSIVRPETVNCLNTGTCPDGYSQPILAAITAMQKRNNENNNFFRQDSDLAIVMLSDSDEGRNSPAGLVNRPQDLVNSFNTIWPSGKKLSVYSISVLPGDTNCLNQLNAVNGGFSFFGPYIANLVGLTGGLGTSICAPDYSVPLKAIGESVKILTNSVSLAHTPTAGSVSVAFVPAQNITFKVVGNKVVFDRPPSAGTQIQVSYQY
jgi:hypothetical protein